MQRLIARVDEVLRDAGEVEDVSVLSVDAGTMVQRGKDFLECHRADLRLFAIAICGTNRLTCPHAAACQYSCVRLRPVVTAVVAVDFRRPAKLTPDNDRDIAIQATFAK